MYRLFLILEKNDYFMASKELSVEDKKNLSMLYVRPEYKSLVKLWDLGILSLQRNVLTDEATPLDIKAFNWALKIQNLVKSNIFHYNKSYADPKKWQQASPAEALVEDLQALKTISEAYGKG